MMLHQDVVLVKMPLHVSIGNHYRLYFENASSIIQMFIGAGIVLGIEVMVWPVIYYTLT